MEIKSHLERQIPPEAHTPMYNWHKYWSRKTWNVVSEFINTYSPTGGIVFDPFGGSGVTAIEALKLGRRVIISDILPISTEIIRLTIKNVSTPKLLEAFKQVEKKVKKEIENLYKTKCRKCGKEIILTCAIWNQERDSQEELIKRKCIDIRYSECPHCKDRRDRNTKPNKYDLELLEKIEKAKIKYWYPKNELYHHNGKPFMKKEKYERLDELFTKRNLLALSILNNTIEEESNRELREFLKIAFTSIVHLCTTMTPVRPTRPFSSAWTEHSYWFAPEFMEQNVWDKFESSVTGKQGLISAKNESNKFFRNIKIGNDITDILEKKADIFIYTGSCFNLMKEMERKCGSKGCVDYIFTDPPYDASVQYSELAYLWVAWLRKDKDYLENIGTDEVVRNERQDKDFNVYHTLLSRSFKEMYNILKAESYTTITFHNPTFKIRNATIYAGVFAGYEFQKIHHQELARPSAKSLLQPFGSAQGDFYLRFYKTKIGTKVTKPEEIDEVRFETIVVETAKRIIAERNEPTPYTILINAVDPELARRGYFSELNTGLDMKSVLQKHLDDIFKLVPRKVGNAEGYEWWFKDTNIIKRLESIPLSERVEQTVLRYLQEKGITTFTEVWNAVSIEFPNSHTTDQMSIKEALETYANQIGTSGNWLIKSNLRINEIEKKHSTIIAILAEIGKALKYKIWIGKNEQSHKLNSMLIKKEILLKEYVTFSDFKKIKNIQNRDVVDDIDLLWISDNKVVKAFEIESTTSMTSALQRGSNIDNNVEKYMLIPTDRKKQFFKKMETPLFSERFEQDNWRKIYFEVLEEEYSKHKSKTKIEELTKIEPKEKTKTKKINDEDQTKMFE